MKLRSQIFKLNSHRKFGIGRTIGRFYFKLIKSFFKALLVFCDVCKRTVIFIGNELHGEFSASVPYPIVQLSHRNSDSIAVNLLISVAVGRSQRENTVLVKCGVKSVADGIVGIVALVKIRIVNIGNDLAVIFFGKEEEMIHIRVVEPYRIGFSSVDEHSRIGISLRCAEIRVMNGIFLVDRIFNVVVCTVVLRIARADKIIGVAVVVVIIKQEREIVIIGLFKPRPTLRIKRTGIGHTAVFTVLDMAAHFSRVNAVLFVIAARDIDRDLASVTVD